MVSFHFCCSQFIEFIGIEKYHTCIFNSGCDIYHQYKTTRHQCFTDLSIEEMLHYVIIMYISAFSILLRLNM